LLAYCIRSKGLVQSSFSSCLGFSLVFLSSSVSGETSPGSNRVHNKPTAQVGNVLAIRRVRVLSSGETAMGSSVHVVQNHKITDSISDPK
jgi:hypothetical protein